MVLQQRHGVSLIRWFVNVRDKLIQTEGNRNAKSSGALQSFHFRHFAEMAVSDDITLRQAATRAMPSRNHAGPLAAS
jgi:hypothetical protein